MVRLGVVRDSRRPCVGGASKNSHGPLRDDSHGVVDSWRTETFKAVPRIRSVAVRARRSEVDHSLGMGEAPGSNPGESTPIHDDVESPDDVGAYLRQELDVRVSPFRM